MKVQFLVVLFFAASQGKVGGTTVNDARKNYARIAAGVDGAAGENLNYVLLSVLFYNQAQKCGGILIHPQFVLTTATCVYE
jgi:secreted trypsin-like serine protease